MKKKLLCLGLVASALLSGCGKKKGIKINTDKEKYTIGICQLVQHDALDAATNGFKEQLKVELEAKGRKVEFNYQNASGDAPLCTTIINGFVSQDVDLILANATPALQAAYNATETIPILGTSITDYGCALNLEMKDGKSGKNVSGTSDLAKISDQIEIMLSLLSGRTINKVGILYCSAEANSIFQKNEAEKALKAKGINVSVKSFSETADLTAVCASLLDCDAVYLPTDNTVASNATIIKANITDKNIPVFAGEAGICEKCGFATLSIDYTQLGRITGTMAAKILLGEKDIREYPVQYDENPTKMYNKAIAEQLGITIPEDFVEIK